MWEQTKRDARKLEGELEMKMGHFSRFCSGFDYALANPAESARTQQGATQMSLELKSLLQRLDTVIKAMETDVAGSDIRQHTVTRHRDILQDYSTEFRRLSSQVDQAKDRAELLAGAKEVSPLLGDAVESKESALLRERGNIQAGSSAMDSVLTQVAAIGSQLERQRTLFDNIGNKVMVVGSKFPVLNGLMNAIRRRRSRDTIVITTVIVVLSLLLLTYLVHRWF